MAGNTRGKLKEHLEGIHRNLDWCTHHIGKCATLIENQLSQLPEFKETGGDPEKEIAFFMTHPMYQAVIGLADGVKTFDELTKGIYDQV